MSDRNPLRTCLSSFQRAFGGSPTVAKGDLEDKSWEVQRTAIEFSWDEDRSKSVGDVQGRGPFRTSAFPFPFPSPSPSPTIVVDATHECSALLDALRVLELVESERVNEGKNLLDQVVSMLVKMSA